MRAALVALAVAFTPFAATAMTAEGMMEQCTGGGAGEEAQARSAFCAGFVRGAVDAWRVSTELGDTEHFCLPDEGIDMNEALGAFGAMMNGNDDVAQMPAGVVLLVALRRTYPCAERPE